MKKYISKIKNLTVVAEPSEPIFKGNQQIGSTPGKRARFVDGRFSTDDKEIIKKLESLSTFGIDFWIDEGETPESVESAESEEKTEQGDLEGMTRQELLQLAKDKELEVDSKATKKELLKLLKGK